MLSQPLHQVELECPAVSIPEVFEVSVNSLGLNESISAGDLELPDGATLITPADATVVSVSEATEAPEEEEAVAVEGEPEVIGAKKDDEEASEG